MINAADHIIRAMVEDMIFGRWTLFLCSGGCGKMWRERKRVADVMGSGKVPRCRDCLGGDEYEGLRGAAMRHVSNARFEKSEPE